MSGLFGGKNNTTTVKPPPQVTQAFTNLMNRGEQVANLPLQQYGGPRVAGFTPDQTSAFQNVENAQGLALPYYNSAASLTASGAGPASAGIGAYMNPYTNDVVNSTLAQINHQNALDQNNLVGNAISRGAWGGDRGYLAQAELANDQERNTNSTISGLYNQGWNTALGASQADLQRQLQAGSQMAGLGTGAQNSALQGAAALLGTGNQQQALAQQQLDVPYQQFQQQQQYPFMTTQFLGSLLGGAAPNLGSSTTTPGPSLASQLAGLGLSAASLFPRAKRGGGISKYDGGGTVIDTTQDANGVFVPHINTGSFAVHNAPTTGGGLGAWFNPLAQYHSDAAPIVTKLPDNILNPPDVLNGTPANHGSDAWTKGLFGLAFADGGEVDGEPDEDLDDQDVLTGLPASLPVPPSAPLPTSVQAAAAVPPGAQPAPQTANSGGLGATRMSPQESANIFGLDDKHMAMLQAGLGILGSNSPHALQAIGEGASQGLAAYRQMKQAEAMQAYRQMAAEAAMKRAEAQNRYYEARSQHIGDRSYVVTQGKTVHVVHVSGDGTTEDHDLGIPTAAWQNAGTREKQLAIEQARLGEDTRHHHADEDIQSKKTPTGANAPGFGNPGSY